MYNCYKKNENLLSCFVLDAEMKLEKYIQMVVQKNTHCLIAKGMYLLGMTTAEFIRTNCSELFNSICFLFRIIFNFFPVFNKLKSNWTSRLKRCSKGYKTNNKKSHLLYAVCAQKSNMPFDWYLKPEYNTFGYVLITAALWKMRLRILLAQKSNSDNNT